jgi:peptidoglycan hydrolase CwlO-like protein
MSLEYTHNDDVADMIYAKEQEIKLLKEALHRIETELNRITNEYARGL